jgi:hypothetical protein
MKEKHQAMLSAIAEVEEEYPDGAVPVSVISDVSGYASAELNNAFRTLVPEFVEHVGYMPESVWDKSGHPPKLMSLTESGRNEASQFPSHRHPTGRIKQLEQEVQELRREVHRLQNQIQSAQSQNRQLKRFILDSEY